MKRALVIRTSGDPALAGAIMDGMTRVIPVDDGAAARTEAQLAVMLLRSDGEADAFLAEQCRARHRRWNRRKGK